MLPLPSISAVCPVAWRRCAPEKPNEPNALSHGLKPPHGKLQNEPNSPWKPVARNRVGELRQAPPPNRRTNPPRGSTRLELTPQIHPARNYKTNPIACFLPPIQQLTRGSKPDPNKPVQHAARQNYKTKHP